MAAGPGDLILEPNEQVILATRPLFLWEPLVLIEVVLVVLTLYFVGIGNATLVGLGGCHAEGEVRDTANILNVAQ